MRSPFVSNTGATRLTIQLLLSLSALTASGLGQARAVDLDAPAAPVTDTQAPMTASARNPAAANDPATAALLETQKKMGALEPWQKKIFEEEVLTEPQRFVQDQKGGQVEVDADGLRRYLTFYGPRALAKPEVKTLVYVSAQEDCAKCAAAIPGVKRQLQSRLSRRGITPVFVSAEDVLGNSGNETSSPGTAGAKSANPVAKTVKPSAPLLELKLAALAKKMGADGAWLAELQQVMDPAHPGEESFKVVLQVRMSAAGVAKDLKADKSLEVLRNDSMEVALSRMVSESLSELGGQASEIAQGAANELEISVSGLTSFSQMKGFHAALQEAIARKLNAITPVELRKISGERIVYAVHTSKLAEDLKSALNLVSFESHGLVVREISRSEDNLSLIQAEVK